MDLGEAMGTRRTFDFLGSSEAVSMDSAAFTHDPDLVASIASNPMINGSTCR